MIMKTGVLERLGGIGEGCILQEAFFCELAGMLWTSGGHSLLHLVDGAVIRDTTVSFGIECMPVPRLVI